MNYEEINNPKELLEYMDKNIKYGFYGIDDKNHYWNDLDFNEKCLSIWTLCDKDRILKYKIGNCYDQTEFEREWFNEHNYEYKALFIWFNLDYENNYNTHTYLIYKDNNKYYYFEHSDEKNKGIYEFNSYIDAIKYEIDKFIKVNQENGNIINDEILNHLEVREYNRPKLPCDFLGFIDNICNSNIIYKNK